MLERFILLAWYGGEGFDSLFNQWEAYGVFEYLLPFLLVFALIFGILSKLNLFGKNSKKINSIIALSLGLIALRTDAVSIFFDDIFPRMGIALGAILMFVIVLGLFADRNNRGLMNTLMWSAFGVAVIIVLQSTEMFGGGINNVFDLIPGWLIPLIVLIVLVAVAASPEKAPNKSPLDSILSKAIGGE